MDGDYLLEVIERADRTLESCQTGDDTGSGSSVPLLNASCSTEFALVGSSLDSSNLAGGKHVISGSFCWDLISNPFEYSRYPKVQGSPCLGFSSR